MWEAFQNPSGGFRPLSIVLFLTVLHLLALLDLVLNLGVVLARLHLLVFATDGYLLAHDQARIRVH